MTIPTQDSLAGFIASEPSVSFAEDGTTQVHYRVGVERWRRETDGTFTQLDSSFHDLLLRGATAERAADRFAKGDMFVAHGQVESRPVLSNGQRRLRPVFVAKRIGHDLAKTRYTVERGPSADHPAGKAAVKSGAVSVPAADADQPEQGVPRPAPRLRPVPSAGAAPVGR